MSDFLPEIRTHIPPHVQVSQKRHAVVVTVPLAPEKTSGFVLRGYLVRYSLLLVVGLISVPIMLSEFFISESLSMPMLGEVAAAVTLGVVLSVARSLLSFVQEHRRHRFSTSQFLMITLDRRRLQLQETGGAAHRYAYADIRGISSKGVLILTGHQEQDSLEAIPESDRAWISTVITLAVRQSRLAERSAEDAPQV